MKVGNTLEGSRIILGCMRISQMKNAEIVSLIEASADCGIDYFDHADIYGGGKSEEVFAKALKDSSLKREKIILQSKCAIHDGMYDFSKEHILSSVDRILKRLDTDYLDVLLLHRPDALMEPEEVAESFDCLQTSGKVRNFGVSNHNPIQIKLLQKYVKQPLIANQMQFSITNASMIHRGINVNTEFDGAVDRDGGVLDFCRLNDITVQAWSPIQFGFFGGTFLGNTEKFPELNKVLNKLAEKYNCDISAIAISWILRHPAKIQAVLGTTTKERVAAQAKAAEIVLTRAEWYEIYKAAGNKLP